MIDVLTYGFPYKPKKGCFGYSTSVIIRGSKTILFDTGGYNIRKIILKNIKDIDIVVISHLHFDHCSNLDLFIKNKIPIYISKKELEYYDKYKSIDCDLFSYFDIIKKQLNIIEVTNNMDIDKNIKIIFTPGHTPGHISLALSHHEDNILIAGDCIKSYKDYKNISNYGNAYNSKEYVATKKKLIDQFNIIYPGHDNVVNKNCEIIREKIEGF